MIAAEGPCLVVGLAGPVLEPAERAWLQKYRPGGVILFSRNITGLEQLQRLCRDLHSVVSGLEIVADHEGGPVSQAARAVGRPPTAWSLGSLDDPDLTAAVHLETGRRLRDSGIDRVLAPVADVLTEMRNPVIGSRAFGRRADLVSRHVRAAVEGLRLAGMKVCLKHWPGHGGTAVDTHLESVAVAAATCREPFDAGIEAGADAIMVGHIPVASAPERRLEPATMSADHLLDLRRQWTDGGGSDLLLFADDCSMGALRSPMGRRDVEVADDSGCGLLDPAILPRAWFDHLRDAGCDRLLIRGIPYLAYPQDGPDSPVPPLETVPVQDLGDTTAPGEDVYREVRVRLGADIAPWFTDRGEELFWWDECQGDRWQVAAGSVGTLEEIKDWLIPRFDRLQIWSPGDRPWSTPLPACRRMLVTSHRPLDRSRLAGLVLAEGGIALAMGHPSLTGDLKKILGPRWQVLALYDVHLQDLMVGQGKEY